MSGPTRGKSKGRATLRDAATSIVRALHEAGHDAYFAGGCVRDRLLGIEPTDYDIATSARPEQVRDLYPKAHGVGEAFGVMLVRTRGHVIEVATFRHDGEYVDGRRPESVTFSDARHDAERRDFTINGLFEDPTRDEIIDFVQGEADLRKGVVRAIGDPVRRLQEDDLRMLRAVRFAARFAFELDDATAAAIRARAGDLAGVSRERIGHEVRRMMEHPSRATAAAMLQSLGLDGSTFNETPRQVALPRLAALHGVVPVPVALGAWLLDRQFHDDEPADKVVSRWSDALMLSNAETRAMRSILQIHDEFRSTWSDQRVAGRKRLAARDEFAGAMQILEAEDENAARAIRAEVARLADTPTGIAPTPWVDGHDLIRMGLTPGPVFRRVLDTVYDAQLEGIVADRASALALAGRLAGGGKG